MNWGLLWLFLATFCLFWLLLLRIPRSTFNKRRGVSARSALILLLLLMVDACILYLMGLNHNYKKWKRQHDLLWLYLIDSMSPRSGLLVYVKSNDRRSRCAINIFSRRGCCVIKSWLHNDRKALWALISFVLTRIRGRCKRPFIFAITMNVRARRALISIVIHRDKRRVSASLRYVFQGI